MFTATRARTQQFARDLAYFGVVTAWWLCQACYQPPTQASVADFTSTPTAAPSGAQDANTGAQGTAPVPTGTDSNTQAVAQNIGTMTFSPASNPFICLGAKDASAGSMVTLTTCSGTSLQKWLLKDTRLQIAHNLCLSFPATGTAALKTTPILSACNSNETTQTVMRGSTGGLAMNSYGANYGLSAQLPTSSNSNITFENLDASQVGQKWIMGADSAASGSLQKGGFRISPADANTLCLTMDGATVSFSACTAAQLQAQSFRWNEAAQIVGNGNCLLAVAAGPCRLAACDTQDPNQRWSSITGKLVVSSGLGCLNTQDASIATCPNDGSLSFVFGAPGPV